MSTFDLIALALCLFSTLIGLWRGVVREILSLLCWLAAILMAHWVAKGALNDLLAQTLGVWWNTFGALPNVRYIVIWATTMMLVRFLGEWLIMLLRRVLQLTGLGPLDRVFGGGFGLIRGVLLVALVVWVLHLWGNAFGAENSVTYPNMLGLLIWFHVPLSIAQWF